MKIIIVSDNHGDKETLELIKYKHFDADYYFHLGDSQMNVKELSPFVSVLGNNDYDYNLPYEKVIDIGSNSFFLVHGHTYGCDIKQLVKQAKKLGCNFVLFGHTHEYMYDIQEGIHIINPGSCSNNRYGKYPSYVVLTIDGNSVDINRVDIK